MAFLEATVAYFAELGVRVERVMIGRGTRLQWVPFLHGAEQSHRASPNAHSAAGLLDGLPVIGDKEAGPVFTCDGRRPPGRL
jgi:hypothetical protein